MQTKSVKWNSLKAREFWIILTLSMVVSTFANASELTASGASGQNHYQDYGLKAKWSLSDTGRILTSFQSTNASGSVTNEYKLGYDDHLSEVTSYDLKGFFRSEPSDVTVIGAETEWNFKYDDLLFKDLRTGFSLGLELSRSSTELGLTGKRKLKQSFSVAGLSVGLNQEVFEDLSIDLGASFYHYTEPDTRFQVGRRRLINLAEAGAGLSSTGYPEVVYSLDLSWDWAEPWSSYYSLSDTKSHFDQLITLFSSLGTEYSFSDQWAAGIAYSWSSGGTSIGSLNTTYAW